MSVYLVIGKLKPSGVFEIVTHSITIHETKLLVKLFPQRYIKLWHNCTTEFTHKAAVLCALMRKGEEVQASADWMCGRSAGTLRLMSSPGFVKVERYSNLAFK